MEEFTTNSVEYSSVPLAQFLHTLVTIRNFYAKPVKLIAASQSSGEETVELPTQIHLASRTFTKVGNCF